MQCNAMHDPNPSKNDNEYKEKEDFNLADLIQEVRSCYNLAKVWNPSNYPTRLCEEPPFSGQYIVHFCNNITKPANNLCQNML